MNPDTFVSYLDILIQTTAVLSVIGSAVFLGPK
jgi:hypothetical protein